MTELARAKEALAKEIELFDAEVAMLKSELADAAEAHRLARSFLAGCLESRKDVLGPFHAAIAAAEQADIDQQVEKLKQETC